MPEETTVRLEFTAPQRLQDAAKVVEVDGFKVTAYGFDNSQGQVTGEFSPLGSLSVDEYLAIFMKNYGTEPEVVYASIVVPTDYAQRLFELSADLRSVQGPGEPFAAPPLNAEAVDAYFAAVSPSSERVESPGDDARAAMTWHPWQYNGTVERQPSGSILFRQYMNWTGGSNLAGYIVANHGFESQIDILTTNASYASGSRPFCAAGYKDQPFAKNYGWTWSATTFATPLGPIEAYADINDQTDACNHNSMAIGIAEPGNISTGGGGMQELALDIIAPAGVDLTGPISGVIQDVSDTTCVAFPWMSLTDCMGVSPSFDPEGSRDTLAPWRNEYAPYKCWFSGDYGTTPPLIGMCL